MSRNASLDGDRRSVPHVRSADLRTIQKYFSTDLGKRVDQRAGIVVLTRMDLSLKESKTSISVKIVERYSRKDQVLISLRKNSMV